MESSIAAAAAGYAATPREVSLILSVLATGLQQERRCPLRPDYDISVQHNSSIRMLRQSVLTWLFKVCVKLSKLASWADFLASCVFGS